MLVILGAVLGALWGARRAILRGGNRLDMLHYGLIYAIALAIAGLFLTLAAGWMGIG